MTKLKRFRTATLREKIKMLREEGSNITTRATDNYYVRLFTLQGAYVEVWSSSHIPWQEVVKIKVLDDLYLLKPYLPSIFFSQQILKSA
jgi:hypothetical protein